jgi:hypothetical protein
MPIFRLSECAKQDLQSVGRYPQAPWGREQSNCYFAKLDHVASVQKSKGRLAGRQ